MPTTVKANVYQTGYSEVTPELVADLINRELTSLEIDSIKALITDIESELCHMCKRQFSTDFQYQEVFDGGLHIYSTHNTPIDSVVSVELNGVAQDFDDGDDYFIYDNYIEFDQYLSSSTENRRGVRITYTISKFWGDDVVHLIKRWVAQLFLNGDNAGVALTNKGFAGVSETLDLPEMKEAIQRVVNRYTSYTL